MFHVLPHLAISLTSVLHPSSIEIIFHDSNDIPKQTEGLRNQSDPTINQAIHSQLRCLSERIRKEFFWIKHIRYESHETFFCCPVCSQKGGVKCHAHNTSGCEWLHLLYSGFRCRNTIGVFQLHKMTIAVFVELFKDPLA